MTYIPRLMCLRCGQAMEIHKTGLKVQVNMRSGLPYYKISTDAYQCHGCDTLVAYASPATEPYTEHFHPDFADQEHDVEIRLIS